MGEIVQCPCCGGTHSTLLGYFGGVTYLRCRGCGQDFRDEEPFTAEDKDFFKKPVKGAA